MNGIRFCSACKFDMDAESKVNQCQHKWHKAADSDDWDMCCLCGLDVEMLYK